MLCPALCPALSTPRSTPRSTPAKASLEESFKDLLAACEAELNRSVHNGATAAAADRLLRRLRRSRSDARAALRPGDHRRLAQVFRRLLDEIKQSMPDGKKHTKFPKSRTEPDIKDMVAGGLAFWLGTVESPLAAKREFWPKDAPEQKKQQSGSWAAGEMRVSERMQLLSAELGRRAVRHESAAAAAAAATAAAASTTAAAASTASASAAPASAAPAAAAPASAAPASAPQSWHTAGSRTPLWSSMPPSIASEPPAVVAAVKEALLGGHVTRDEFVAAMGAAAAPAVHNTWARVYDVLFDAQLAASLAHDFGLLAVGSASVPRVAHSLGLKKRVVQIKLSSVRQRMTVAIEAAASGQGGASEASSDSEATEFRLQPPPKRPKPEQARTCTEYQVRSALIAIAAILPQTRLPLTMASLAPPLLLPLLSNSCPCFFGLTPHPLCPTRSFQPR